MPSKQKTEVPKPKKAFLKIPQHLWSIFAFEAVMFSFNLALGVLAGVKVRQLVKIDAISLAPISIWQLFISFILATLSILFVVYFFKRKGPKKFFFKAIFWLAIVFGNLFFWSLWLPSGALLLFLFVLIWALIKKPFIWVFNLAVIFSSAGVGAALGVQLTPLVVILMLLIFALYDFVAVHLTKHMVKMAKEMIEQKAIVGYVVPKTAKEFKSNIEEVKQDGKFMILGGGDVVFPIVLAVSCLNSGIIDSIIVAGFSLLGLLAVFMIFATQKEKRPLPALPPIALAGILGYLLTLVI